MGLHCLNVILNLFSSSGLQADENVIGMEWQIITDDLKMDFGCNVLVTEKYFDVWQSLVSFSEKRTGQLQVNTETLFYYA